MNKLLSFLISGFIIACSPMASTPQNTISTRVIAHRGAWKNTNVPQNSLAASTLR